MLSHWKWGFHGCLLMGTMPCGGAHLWKCLLCLLQFCCLKRIRCVSIWGYKCNARPRLCASVSSCQLFLAIKEETKLWQLSFDTNLILFLPPLSLRSRGKKHSVILRTQLTVRVHACIGEYCATCLCNTFLPGNTHAHAVRCTREPKSTLQPHFQMAVPGFCKWYASNPKPPTWKRDWLVCVKRP